MGVQNTSKLKILLDLFFLSFFFFWYFTFFPSIPNSFPVFAFFFRRLGKKIPKNVIFLPCFWHFLSLIMQKQGGKFHFLSLIPLSIFFPLIISIIREENSISYPSFYYFPLIISIMFFPNFWKIFSLMWRIPKLIFEAVEEGCIGRFKKRWRNSV